jgi:hypothetical protein
MDQRKADDDLTLEEFLMVAPVHLDAFAEAVRRATEDGEIGFPKDREAKITWWWNEVAAYFRYSEIIQEIVARAGGRSGTQN